jgi:DNA-binding cell septation regulator SpoVG
MQRQEPKCQSEISIEAGNLLKRVHCVDSTRGLWILFIHIPYRHFKEVVHIINRNEKRTLRNVKFN